MHTSIPPRGHNLEAVYSLLAIMSR